MLRKIVFFIILISVVPVSMQAQQADSLASNVLQDSLYRTVALRSSRLQVLLEEHLFLNVEASPAQFSEQKRQPGANSNLFFYIILAVVFLYAAFVYFFRKYLQDVFRIYFNTSLNQSQITDQLRQNELPSLFANLVFIVAIALFASQCISGSVSKETQIRYLVSAAVLLTVIYLVKYFSLKFTGWISNFSNQAGQYIFIVFIVNKVLGFVILPIAVIVALGNQSIRQPLLMVGLMIILFMLFSRFFKAYKIVRAGAKLELFHFIIFIFAVEVLPLLLLYKAGKLYLTNLS